MSARPTIAVTAAVLLTTGGCTAGRPAAAPSTPAPVPSTGSPSVTPAPTLDADEVLPDTGQRWVWREDSHGAGGPYTNVDGSVGPGAYELTVVCLGGTLTVKTTPGRTTSVDCAGTQSRIPICLTRTGLTVTTTWTRPPYIDFVSQLDRMEAGRRCR